MSVLSALLVALGNCYLLAGPVAMLPTQLPQRISPWHQRLSSIVPFLCEPSLTSLTE